MIQSVFTRVAALGFTAAVITLTGCGSPSSTLGSAAATTVPQSRLDNIRAAAGLETNGRVPVRGQTSGWISPDAKRAKQLFYSGDFDNSSIAILTLKGKSKGEITSGLQDPERLFVDKQRDLWATNLGTGEGNVVMYKPGATSPSETVAMGVNRPTGLVVGGDGTMYCANVGNDTVTVYPLGQTTPSETLTISASPENLAVDSDNNLYVSTGLSVYEFAKGTSTGKNLNLTIGSPGAIEVDKKGNLVVIDASVPSIDVFPAGETAPSKEIPVTAGDPFELSMNKAETTVYASVLVSAGWIIQDVAYPDGTTMATKISSGVPGWPLAISPDNAL